MLKHFVARCGVLAIALVCGVSCGSEPERSTRRGAPPSGTTFPVAGATGPSGVMPSPVGSVAGSPTGPGIIGGTAGRGALPAPAAPDGAAVMMPIAPAPATGNVLPCGVNKALVANCASCHGAALIGGAPMPLVTWDDFQKPAKTIPSMKVHELVKIRINDKMKPMPPGGSMAAADLTTLNTWLSAGATAGTDADKQCEMAVKPPPGLTFGALTPLPGETCYDFQVNGGQTLTDKSPYQVPVGEHYVQFYYAAPWPAGTLGVRYGAKFDNQEVVHHWLLFSTTEADTPGTHRVAPLPTLLGVNAQLLAGWAVGGANMEMPEGVGFELPANGAKLDVQWHYYNSTAKATTDVSAVQVCTVPPTARPNVAAMTWVGTENLGGNVWTGGPGMPAHQMSDFTGTCRPGRRGMNATDPIKIIGFWPHMHQLGVNMKAIINRKSGQKEMVFDKPFDFNKQIHYLQQHDLMPGDTLTAVCTFNNTTDRGVPFGESSDSEMCYNFVYSYPAHALENGVVSLIGATNTCW